MNKISIIKTSALLGALCCTSLLSTMANACDFLQEGESGTGDCQKMLKEIFLTKATAPDPKVINNKVFEFRTFNKGADRIGAITTLGGSLHIFDVEGNAPSLEKVFSYLFFSRSDYGYSSEPLITATFDDNALQSTDHLPHLQASYYALRSYGKFIIGTSGLKFENQFPGWQSGAGMFSPNHDEADYIVAKLDESVMFQADMDERSAIGAIHELLLEYPTEESMPDSDRARLVNAVSSLQQSINPRAASALKSILASGYCNHLKQYVARLAGVRHPKDAASL